MPGKSELLRRLLYIVMTAVLLFVFVEGVVLRWQ